MAYDESAPNITVWKIIAMIIMVGAKIIYFKLIPDIKNNKVSSKT